MNHLRRINVLIKLLSRAELEVKRRFLQAHARDGAFAARGLR